MHKGVGSGDGVCLTRWGPPQRIQRIFFNFKLLMQVFMHLYCVKLLEARNQDRGRPRRLIDVPWGLKMWNERRLKNLAWGLNCAPANSRPAKVCIFALRDGKCKTWKMIHQFAWLQYGICQRLWICGTMPLYKLCSIPYSQSTWMSVCDYVWYLIYLSLRDGRLSLPMWPRTPPHSRPSASIFGLVIWVLGVSPRQIPGY